MKTDDGRPRFSPRVTLALRDLRSVRRRLGSSHSRGHCSEIKFAYTLPTLEDRSDGAHTANRKQCLRQMSGSGQSVPFRGPGKRGGGVSAKGIGTGWRS